MSTKKKVKTKVLKCKDHPGYAVKRKPVPTKKNPKGCPACNKMWAARNEKVEEPSKKSQKRLTEFTFKVNRLELTYLRDLFTVMLPTNGDTVSEMLAKAQDMGDTEEELWDKITTLCETAKIPVGDDAPDFMVTVAENPNMEVIQVDTSGMVEDISDDDDEDDYEPLFAIDEDDEEEED